MSNNTKAYAIAAALAAATLLFGDEEYDSTTSNDSSDEGDEDLVQLPRAKPRDLPKSRGFFQRVNKMDNVEFHSHFRMGFG